MTVQEVTDKLTGTRPFNYVAKGITPLTWRKIKALGINGIDAEAHLQAQLPHVHHGGVPGRLRGRRRATARRPRAAAGQAAAGHARRDPLRAVARRPGHPHRLPAQHSGGRRARRAADPRPATCSGSPRTPSRRKVKETQALSGTVDRDGRQDRRAAGPGVATRRSTPTTWPRPPATWTTAAFDEVYEPGSTGKVITASAALQEGVATPDTPVTVPNTLTRAGTVFHDSHDHPHRAPDVRRVLAQSSNIGTMLVGEQLPPSHHVQLPAQVRPRREVAASASPARPAASSPSPPTGAGRSATR